MSKHQEWISLKDTGNLENDPQGGYFTVWEITGFGMGRETAKFTYDRRGPSFPNNANTELVASMVMEAPRGPIVRYIFDLDTIQDDERDELQDRGVKIIIERAPTVTDW